MTFGCLDCSRQLNSINALAKHCSLAHHRFGCKPCRRSFVFTGAMEQHIRYAYPHRAPSTNRNLQPSSSTHEGRKIEVLKQHTLSPAHKGKKIKVSEQYTLSSVQKGGKIKVSKQCSSPQPKGKKFKCLFCERKFKTPSAIAMHIESGRHNITRHQVTAAVHKLRIVPTISVNRRLKGPILPPASIITYSATRSAFNGTAYECYFCHRTCRTLKGLNVHLNSPAHDDNEFKCPNIKCHTNFKLVSGLIQHVECGTCGLAKFEEVKRHFQSLTDQFSRALTF